MKTTNTKLKNENLIVEAIEEWYRGHSYGPSFRDLSQGTGISLGTVFSACQDLRDKGILSYEDGVARTIKLSR